MDSFEALDDYLETESIITTNWLSNELAIPLTKADELLNNYILQNKNKLNTTYLVMGYDNENIFNIRLDSEDSKPVTLKRTLSKNIYSITKSNSAPSPSSSSSSSPLNSLMVHSMLKQADSLYQQDHFIGDHDSYFYNNQGMVKNPSISIKGQFERVHSEHNLQFKRSLSASGSIQGKTFVPPPKPKETLPTPAVSAAISISKPSSNTLGNSFFGRTSTIVPKPSTAPSAEVTVPTVLATKSITGEKRKLEKKYQSTNNEPTVDSDEEWDIEVEGETKKKVRIEEASGNAEANKENISTQKMEEENQDGSEDDGEEGSDDDQDEEPNSKEGEVGEKKEKKPRKKKSSKKQKIHVHGAMDNFMEDMAIEQYKQEQQLQENGIQVTRMKKVLVEKCTMDENGYLVTEMVYEDVPDTDPVVSNSDLQMINKIDPLKKSGTAESTNKENRENLSISEKKTDSQTKEKGLKVQQQPSSSGNKTKKQEPVKPAGGQQKSMMSFFGKKA